MANESTIDLINQIDEFTELHDFMNDDDLDEAMGIIVKLIMKPEVPSTVAVPMIVKLSAIAAKLSIMATIYTTTMKGPAGSDNAKKKAVYYTAADSLNKIVDALKYAAKYNMV
jgi:hypothetical protein